MQTAQIATVAGAIRDDDLCPAQVERLAALVGSCIRIAGQYPECVLSLARLWDSVGAVYRELLEQS